MNKLFVKGVKHGLPIGLGYLSVSFAFGTQCTDSGLTILQALLISMTNLTSAGQLAGLQVMVTQAALASGLIEMALTQFVINLRYALMGLSLGQKLGPTMNTPRRMFFSFANTDEIFAVASAQPEKLHHHYLYGLMLMPYIGWSLGTLLGAAAGEILPEFVTSALGIAIYGMFIAIVIPPACKEKPIAVVALTAAAISICFRYIPLLSSVSGGFVVIICAVIAATLGALLFPVKDEAPAAEEVEA
ncbi:MAG: AzlC family ABC transporter permease [Clostridiales bacterium]|nr:AzlC family ABC transporter permease [Clostridiales bacterium]